MDMRWSLADFYPSFDSPEYQKDFDAFIKAIKAINDWVHENLQGSDNAAEKIEGYINRMNDFGQFSTLYSFASLSNSVNSSDKTALKYMDRYTNARSDLAACDAKFKKFVGGLDNLSEIIAQSPLLAEHAFMLNEIKRKNRYMLAEDVEVAISKMQITGSNAWNIMKENLVSSLSIEVEVEGETKKLPYPAVRNLAYSANPQTRKDAYIAELEGYKTVENGVAAALNSIKGEAITLAKLRGYDSVLDMTLKSYRMEKKTLDALIGAIENYLPSLRRYFRKKGELLGHTNGLPFYDMFAPVGTVDMRFTYEEATDFVVKQFYSFSPKLGDFAKQAIEKRWIDAEPRKGKRGGAFCSSNKAINQSRILLNFDGSFGNVSTLAHELGHAYHSACLREKSYLNAHYTAPIAETASTFTETIVCNAALSHASDKDKIVLLENQISRNMQVIVDIYSRFVFETHIIKARESGPLSVDELNTAMADAQKVAYGDGLDPAFLHPYMWLGKVHYYYVSRNFYNFPYAYGQMFALGLYAQYLSEGTAFIPQYDALLAATTTNSLEDIGKLAGIDVTDIAFWESSLKLMEKDIDTFCAL